jgi:hypothetical protein
MPNPTTNDTAYVQPYGTTKTRIHLGTQQMPTRLTMVEAIEEYDPFHNCHPLNIHPLAIVPSLITYFDVCYINPWAC